MDNPGHYLFRRRSGLYDSFCKHARKRPFRGGHQQQNTREIRLFPFHSLHHSHAPDGNIGIPGTDDSIPDLASSPQRNENHRYPLFIENNHGCGWRDQGTDRRHSINIRYRHDHLRSSYGIHALQKTGKSENHVFNRSCGRDNINNRRCIFPNNPGPAYMDVCNNSLCYNSGRSTCMANTSAAGFH